MMYFCALIPQNVLASAPPAFTYFAPRILGPCQELGGESPVFPHLGLVALALPFQDGTFQSCAVGPESFPGEARFLLGKDESRDALPIQNWTEDAGGHANAECPLL